MNPVPALINVGSAFLTTNLTHIQQVAWPMVQALTPVEMVAGAVAVAAALTVAGLSGKYLYQHRPGAQKQAKKLADDAKKKHDDKKAKPKNEKSADAKLKDPKKDVKKAGDKEPVAKTGPAITIAADLASSRGRVDSNVGLNDKNVADLPEQNDDSSFDDRERRRSGAGLERSI